MRLVLPVLLLTFGQVAEAGPWPRDPDRGFLSFSAEYNEDYESVFTAFYAEYGVTSSLTAGLDLGFSDDELYKAVLFARYPLTRADSPWKVAADLGLGVAEDEAVIRPGFHIGRGLTLAERSGWFAIEMLAYYQADDDAVDVSTDITLGLNMSARHKWLVQLQNGNQPSDPDYLNLATSLVVETLPDLHLELGVKAGLIDDNAVAMKLGIWRSF